MINKTVDYKNCQIPLNIQKHRYSDIGLGSVPQGKLVWAEVYCPN